ncbi:MAG: response regulator transcription factor [Burkholderiaceae bacterium]|nr:DNA-binding response regulator [Pseudomonadota bacterium]RZP21490.1 MAG: response regulator transcription factor [Burkholderiaceae bacterium]|tara:strand:+ start:1261 stop:1899 length:639 start_codon:yes stop_codon:yes gene_type:complete
MNKINVILADDHAVVRMGFRLLLQDTKDITVAGEAESGEEVLKLLNTLTADIIVMDLSMPGIGGLETISRIVSKNKPPKILILSAHEDAIHPKRSLKAGASGYLSKRGAAEELIKAIRQIHSGNMYIEPSIAQKVAMSQMGGETSPVDVLSEREFDVFMALANGKTVNQIAETLHLSPRTVGTHLYNIKQKLNASNQTELAFIAIKSGLINP